jgi:hypothetical protein
MKSQTESEKLWETLNSTPHTSFFKWTDNKEYFATLIIKPIAEPHDCLDESVIQKWFVKSKVVKVVENNGPRKFFEGEPLSVGIRALTPIETEEELFLELI